MIIKMLELRDRMTLVPILAIKIDGNDGPLARHAGYGRDRPCILVAPLRGGRLCFDPYEYGVDRTFKVAHFWLIDNFDDVNDGDVVDVEFILGEVLAPKRPEADT